MKLRQLHQLFSQDIISTAATATNPAAANACVSVSTDCMTQTLTFFLNSWPGQGLLVPSLLSPMGTQKPFGFSDLTLLDLNMPIVGTGSVPSTPLTLYALISYDESQTLQQHQREE